VLGVGIKPVGAERYRNQARVILRTSSPVNLPELLRRIEPGRRALFLLRHHLAALPVLSVDVEARGAAVLARLQAVGRHPESSTPPRRDDAPSAVPNAATRWSSQRLRAAATRPSHLLERRSRQSQGSTVPLPPRASVKLLPLLFAGAASRTRCSHVEPLLHRRLTVAAVFVQPRQAGVRPCREPRRPLRRATSAINAAPVRPPSLPLFLSYGAAQHQALGHGVATV
jgi:hypothetical protein